MKVKKGDTVQIMAGNDRGKRGEVVRVIAKDHKIVVRGMNIARKHAKPRSAQNLRATQTGLVDVEMPMDVSNVEVVSPAGKATRVNYLDEGGVLKRYSNKFDEVLD